LRDIQKLLWGCRDNSFSVGGEKKRQLQLDINNLYTLKLKIEIEVYSYIQAEKKAIPLEI